MTVCANCDHLDICHEEKRCCRVVANNQTCSCYNYVAAQDSAVTQTAPSVVFGAPDTELQRYMQEMIQRMMFKQNLTE